MTSYTKFLIYLDIIMNKNVIAVLKPTFLCIGLFASMAANAHGVQGGGLINGLMHPVFGIDHLLAMVAVGALSVQMGGRSIWAIPLAFVSLMLAGGVWGMIGMPFFAVEIGIALSVLVLGVAIAFDKKMPMIASMLFVGGFAVFHGYAHGAEMPNLAQPTLYATGFILATAFLHILGIAIGEIARNAKKGNDILRFVGAGVAGIGVSILFGF